MEEQSNTNPVRQGLLEQALVLLGATTLDGSPPRSFEKGDYSYRVTPRGLLVVRKSPPKTKE